MSLELLIVAMFSPLLAAGVLGALRLMGRTPQEALSAGLVGAAAGLQALGALLAAISVLRQGSDEVRFGTWVATPTLSLPLSVHLAVEPLAFLGMSGVLVALTAWFARTYLHREPAFLTVQVGLGLLGGGAALVALSSTLVGVLAGWELAGLASGLLIATYPERRAASQAAARALLTNRVGDVALLAAIVMSAAWAGHTDLVAWTGQAGAPWIAAALLVPACAKAGLVPFAPWVERAVEGPTPTSALFYGGVATHLGLLLLVRTEPLLTPGLRVAVVLLALTTVTYAGLSSLAQPDVKRRLVLRAVAWLAVPMGLVGLGLVRTGLAVGIAVATWSVIAVLLAPSWLAMRRLRPLAPVPRWLAGREALQVQAAARFGLEARVDKLVGGGILAAVQAAHQVERRGVQPLLGAAAPAVDALSGLAAWEEGGADPTASADADAWAHGVLATLTRGASGWVHAVEDRLIARGVGVLLPERGHRLAARLAAFERALQRPELLVGMVFALLMAAWWGGGR